jgi:tetratricopeptide (TPR) repeat protein
MNRIFPSTDEIMDVSFTWRLYMKATPRLVPALPLFLLVLVLPQEIPAQKAAPLSLLVRPGLSLPIGEDTEIYDMGGGGDITLRYDILPFLSAGLIAGYSYIPVKTLPVFDPRTLSIAYGGLDVGVMFNILKNLNFGIFAGGGYYYGFMNEDTVNSANNPFIHAGAAISYRLIPSFSIGVEGSYRNFLGLAQDMMVHIGGIIHIGAGKTGSLGIPRNRNLDLLDIELNNIFPVFYKYYDENPLGVAVIRNTGTEPIEEVKVSFFVQQYMDNPKECIFIDELEAGEERQIPLYALFTDSVLGISEGTKVSVNLIVESTMDGVDYGNEYIQTLRLYDRNAMTWDDDRKAASFVTSKDPDVLRFSKNVSGMIKNRAGRALNQNFLLACAIFQALDLYGMSYEIDPSSSYQDFSAKAMMVDYLQFPAQTLEYRAGDCDDLSILYSALLEAVGIETAFITIPGHIFMAFSLDMSFDGARRFFNNSDEIIFLGDTAWLPVEITALDEGFLRAWKIGAREWQENHDKGLAALIPIRSSWSLYEPVGYSKAEESDIEAPGSEILVSSFLDEIMKFIETEIFAREARYKEEIDRTNGRLGSINKLGTLYARFGMNDKARAEFGKILKRSEYLPALINLGMLNFLEGDLQGALEYYRRAQAADPEHPNVLLGIARISYELGDYGTATSAYDTLELVKPELAERFAYLELGGTETTARASDATVARETAVWEDE